MGYALSAQNPCYQIVRTRMTKIAVHGDSAEIGRHPLHREKLCAIQEVGLTRFDEAPVPPVTAVTRVRRIRPVRIPQRVIRPIRGRLRPARRNYKRNQTDEEGTTIEVEPPETYGEHGELIHPHQDNPKSLPHIDLED